MKKIAKAPSGVELLVEVINAHEANKQKWIIVLDSQKIQMNKDGKSFKSPSHGQDFYLVD